MPTVTFPYTPDGERAAQEVAAKYAAQGAKLEMTDAPMPGAGAPRAGGAPPPMAGAAGRMGPPGGAPPPAAAPAGEKAAMRQRMKLGSSKPSY